MSEQVTSGAPTRLESYLCGRWVSGEDGHYLEGIIVRDLLRQCRGCPTF